MDPKKSYRPAAGLLLAALILLAACDTTEPSLHVPEYVVESYQIANEPLKRVRLSLTEDVNVRYNVTALAVRNANVQVHLLAENGDIERTYPYRALLNEPGVYEPEQADPVLPKRTYALEITFPDNTDRITAQTTVPGAFEILQSNADRLVYQDPERLALTVTQSEYATRQSIFIFSTQALMPAIENLTPLYLDIIYDVNDLSEVEPGELDPEEMNEFLVGGSPPVNEGNYDINPDGTLVIRLPWFAVVFYGPNRITASAIDENVYDFVRVLNVQQGGSTLSPGEIPNVLEHIDGGTGIFGSMARVTAEVYIERR